MVVAMVVYQEICSKSYHDLDLGQKKVAHFSRLTPSDRWCSTNMAAFFAGRDNVDVYFIHITGCQACSWLVINDPGNLSYTGNSNYNA